jgi:uncharacterized protein YlxW (UPF0749 family)
MPDPTPGPTPGPRSGSGPEDRPRSPETPASGRSRRLRALSRPSRSQLVVGVLLALVGFAAIVQVRATEVDDTYAGLREQDLIDVLNGLAGTTQRAEAEIERLEEARQDLRTDSRRVGTALEEAQTQADALAILAGTVPVTGPGVRVTITETDQAVRVQDMIDLVQELRTSNAEAMQLNGKVRLVAQSAFSAGTGGLVVDGELLGPPYVLDAIGAPDTLAGAISIARGVVSELEADGAVVDIQELQSIDIESVREPAQSEYATPDLEPQDQ